MANYTEYRLTVDNPQNIALPQVVAANDPFILNGALGNNASNIANLSSYGFSYAVTINSNEDLTLIDFTISGYHNGTFITEEVGGPNATIVTTQSLFDIVTSITADTDIDVGDALTFGTSPNRTLNNVNNLITYSLPIMIDFPYWKQVNCVVSVDGILTADGNNFNATYDFYGALGKIVGNNKTIEQMIGHELVLIGSGTLANPIIPITLPFRYLVLKITMTETEGQNPVYIYPETVLRFSQESI